MPTPIGREISPGHRVVGASMIPDVLLECPQCGSKDFILVGDFHRGFEQVFEGGKPKEPKEQSVTLATQATQEIQGVICEVCNVHTIIEDDDSFERDSLIFDLHTQVATLQGRVAAPPAKEWKN